MRNYVSTKLFTRRSLFFTDTSDLPLPLSWLFGTVSRLLGVVETYTETPRALASIFPPPSLFLPPLSKTFFFLSIYLSFVFLNLAVYRYPPVFLFFFITASFFTEIIYFIFLFFVTHSACLSVSLSHCLSGLSVCLPLSCHYQWVILCVCVSSSVPMVIPHHHHHPPQISPHPLSLSRVQIRFHLKVSKHVCHFILSRH